MSIHGHEVLNYLHEVGGVASREEFIKVIAERFGADARFHTCSAEGMDSGTLFEFLSQRSKIVRAEDRIKTNVEAICQH